MEDNTCICCGRVIPEGRQICLTCGDYDNQQSFKARIRTNGDSVRSMNNHELAELICELAGIGVVGEKAILAWLNSEVQHE